jgi:hypothetical protein
MVKENIEILEERKSVDKIQVAFGHHVDEYTILNFEERDIKLFTFIREPVVRIISDYLFHKRLNTQQKRPYINFDRFYKRQGSNYVSNWLVKKFPSAVNSRKKPKYRQAIDVLKKFEFVCSTDDFSSKIEWLLDQLGISDMTPAKQNVAFESHEKNELLDKYSDRLMEENRDDVLLFREYTKGKDQLNPFGYDENEKLDFVSKVFHERNSSTKRKMLHKAIKKECEFYGYSRSV